MPKNIGSLNSSMAEPLFSLIYKGKPFRDCREKKCALKLKYKKIYDRKNERNNVYDKKHLSPAPDGR